MGFLITDEFAQTIRVLSCVAVFPQRNVAFVTLNDNIKVTHLVPKQASNTLNNIKVTQLVTQQAK